MTFLCSWRRRNHRCRFWLIPKLASQWIWSDYGWKGVIVRIKNGHKYHTVNSKKGEKVQKSFNFWSKHGCRFTIQLSTAPGKKGKFCCPGWFDNRLVSEIEKWIPAFYRQKPGLWLADLAVQPISGLVFGGKWLEFISQSQIKCDHNFSVASLNCTM